MGWIPIYADDHDFAIICNWLNNEEEIAYLVANGEKSGLQFQVSAN